MLGQSLGQGRGYAWFGSVTTAFACLWIVGHLCAAPQNKPAHISTTSGSVRPGILFVQTGRLIAGPLASRFPDGSGIVLLRSDGKKRTPERLTDGFFAAADPQVNFTATKILFSAQQTRADKWQIWEMELNGSQKRQITRCADDCLRAAYLPADEIALTVEEFRGKGRQSYLAVVKADGSQLHRITFGPADFELETVLRDGRIIASANWPLEQDTASRSLFTLRPDGTALESLRCEHKQPATQRNASELEDGSVLFIRASRKVEAGGELMHIQRGSAAATALGTHDAVYESPRQLSPGELLVAKAAAASTGAQRKFDLYAVQARVGAIGEQIFADPRLLSIQPVPIVPHEVPKHFWSTLNPESNTGYFISLNSYASADASSGHFSKTIAQVRVLTMNAADGQERLLGEAPVESDGSFYVRVPANTPVRFVLLDAKGQPIHQERGWVWTRPGEQRGCTGCHGDKNVAPENRWPLTLKRFDTPIPLGDTEHASAISSAK